MTRSRSAYFIGIIAVFIILATFVAATYPNKSAPKLVSVHKPWHMNRFEVTTTSTTTTTTLPPTTTTIKVTPKRRVPIGKGAVSTQIAAPTGWNSRCHNRPAPDDPKAFVYWCESGNNPASVNKGGCRGLGQACPGSKLPCSSSDYPCQDAWFTSYMVSRYGSWDKAKAFWIAHNWW